MLAAAMRICTWNVDGLKGRAKVERVVSWLRDNKPDIVGLQEAGTSDPKSVISAFQSEGFRCELRMKPEDKSPKQGVAILSRHPLEVIQECLSRTGAPGRPGLLTASTAGLSFTTVCVPSVSSKDRRGSIKRKLAWLDALSEHLRERKADDGPAVLCWDFNINPKPIDNYYHWENRKEPRAVPGFRKMTARGSPPFWKRVGPTWSATRIQTREYSRIGIRVSSTTTTRVCGSTTCWKCGRRQTASMRLDRPRPLRAPRQNRKTRSRSGSRRSRLRLKRQISTCARLAPDRLGTLSRSTFGVVSSLLPLKWLPGCNLTVCCRLKTRPFV